MGCTNHTTAGVTGTLLLSPPTPSYSPLGLSALDCLWYLIFITNDDADKHPTHFTIDNRWTNLLQSLLCAVCLFITDALKQIPRSVLWGFFIYMALESLPGSQFWERLQLFITDSKRLKK